ncbi:bifunctional diguanylate cyclase/phosphodiesterase [Planomonospora sp. ID67723]|uniref:putative bifunctional diguanylate cyclase/phosphodiesterase n=1 Tax=Planomonospora sp. ID67723 TaxID=2738134 RepID=UPI0018C40642|nr:bifunctional diguanylate cyclase/phosphodiesterase [Planomonospora sp. ID67723]MBG0829472.1 bifunctional diguanylate cyclase/phosphodiesterase [Planomonospora sp. ID67723]
MTAVAFAAVPASAFHGVVAPLGLLPGAVAAVGFGVRAATYRALDRGVRRAWAFIALGVPALAVSVAASAAAGMTVDAAPGVAARVVFVLVTLTGLLMFPARDRTRKEAYKNALDVVAVMAATFMITWYLVLGPIVSTHELPPLRAAATVGYPLADLVVIAGAAMVLLRGTVFDRRPLLLLIAGLVALTVGDGYLGYSEAAGGASVWQPACWLTVFYLMALAAAEQCRLAGSPRGTAQEPSPSRTGWLPYLATGMGCLLLIVASWQTDLSSWTGLVAGGAVVTATVTVRQFVVLRENHDLAVTDALTGLSNRTQLHIHLARALHRAHGGVEVAVLQLNLNGLKQINDNYGQETGDAVLVAVSDILRGNVRDSDTVARLGGDEFAIVLTSGGADGAITVAERVIAAMDQPIAVAGRHLSIGAGIGIVVSGGDQDGPQEVSRVLHQAGMAMVAAKKKPVSAWELFADDLERKESESAELRCALNTVIEDGHLRLQYQPIVNLVNGELTGVEALIRWEHPVRGMISPLEFIPLAERTGAITKIGLWVLRTACEQVLQWREKLPRDRQFYLSVNLSPRQLEQQSLAEDVAAILTQTGFAPGDLVMEITEGAVVDDHSAIPQLAALRAQGIRIALDDFGTGYSSLRYLTKLPVDVLKLDRCFVTELDGTPEGAVVAEAVIRLSQILRLDTVAEGIEHPAQLTELATLGCHKGQGYHFARPLTPAAMDEIINQSPHGWPCLPPAVHKIEAA